MLNSTRCPSAAVGLGYIYLDSAPHEIKWVP